MSNELKPCPFCGGEPCVQESPTVNSAWYWISCSDCKTGTAWHAGDKDAAIAAWNTRAETRPTVIVHFSRPGDTPDYYVSGDVKLFVIDEDAPGDRVYQYITQTPQDVKEALLSDDFIGSKHDVRHAAISAAVEQYLTGKPAIRLVKDDE